MLTPSVTFQQRTRKCQENPIKIVNIVEGNIHLSWKTWGISIKFSGKIWFMIGKMEWRGVGGDLKKEGSKWRPSPFGVKVFAFTINDVSVKPVISIMFLEVRADGNLSWMQHIHLTETKTIGIIYKANHELNCKLMVSFCLLVYPDLPQLWQHYMDGYS